MKNVSLKFIALLLLSGFVFVSCDKDDDDDDDTMPTEYIATNADFQNFASWVKESELSGPDPALGMAHHGNDSTVTRNIYFMDGQDPVDGEYPVGTIIVKHSSNPASTVNEVTAMVKRGNDFNTSGGDWEWFMLEPNGNIMSDSAGMMMRGANLMGGMCSSCHTYATTDFVFAK